MAKQDKNENVDAPADAVGNVTVGSPLGAVETVKPAVPRRATQATQPASGDEERTITIALTPRQWALVDRQIERTGRTESEWWRRFLAPHLRP